MTIRGAIRRARRRSAVWYIRRLRRWRYRHIRFGFTGWVSMCECPSWMIGLGLHWRSRYHKRVTRIEHQVLYAGNLRVGAMEDSDGRN